MCLERKDYPIRFELLNLPQRIIRWHNLHIVVLFLPSFYHSHYYTFVSRRSTIILKNIARSFLLVLLDAFLFVFLSMFSQNGKNFL